MLLSAVMLLTAVGCTDAGEDTPPTPPQQELELQVVVDDVTKGSVTYSVTPSVATADYLVAVLTKEFVDEIVEDEFIVNNILSDLSDYAASTGKTLAEYMPDVIDRGNVTEQVIKGLTVDTDYVLVAFGVDAANNYAANSAVFRAEFTTEDVVMSDCTFDVQTSVLMNAAQFVVTPSDPNILWHMSLVTAASYDAYTDPAGEYKMSDAELYMALLNSEIQQYLGAGYTIEEVMEAVFLQGTLTLEASGMTANTEYGYMIAGLEIEDDVVYMITEPQYDTFTTGEAAQSDMTFEISVENVEMNRADVLITPSNLQETFTWYCSAYDGVSTEKDLMDSYLSANQMWLDWGMMLYTGVQDFTAEGPNYKYKLDAPDTDYYIMVFGYQGGVTTLPEFKYFRTLPAPDPADATFNITSSEIAPYSFKMNVDSSDETTYYTIDVTTDLSQLDEEELKTTYEAELQGLLAMQQMFNPGYTMVQLLSSYFYNGDYVLSAADLVPETSYSAFVVAFNNNGEVVKIHKFPNVATTSALGNVNPSVELVGYYSGDDENGELFGQPDATKGKCIMVVKYGNFDGASALYGISLPEQYSDAPAYPDGEVMRIFPMANWSRVDLAQPYSFYVADWEFAQTACALAHDANGVMGIIGRLAVKPTADAKGDYADLKALVTELNNQAAAPAKAVAPKREVAAEKQNKPVITALTGKKVEEPVYNVPQSIERPMKAPLQKGALRVVKHVSRVRTK